MYKLNEESMFYDISDGQAVVINFQNGMYYGFSSLSSAVLDKILNGQRPEDVIRTANELAGAPANLSNQLEKLIDKIKDYDILVETDEPSIDATPFEDWALNDGFDTSVEEFSEIQDLILADPIHDVDLTQGWPTLIPDNQE